MNYEDCELTFRYSNNSYKKAKRMIEILQEQRTLGMWIGYLRLYKVRMTYYVEQYCLKKDKSIGGLFNGIKK